MPKVKILESENEKLVCVHCPGCNMWHPFRVKSVMKGSPMWTWDGSEDSPTFQPSMLVNKSYPESRCHSFVKNGRIEFLSDCHHDLKNTTVDLPDLDKHGDPLTYSN